MNLRAIFALLLLLFAPSALAAGGGSPHHMAVFLGATTADTETNFTAGLDYAYHLSSPDWLSVGIITDFVFADEIATLVLGGFFFHATEALKFVAGAGPEFVGGKTKLVLRAGLGYGFHVGSLTIEPAYNADFVAGHVAHEYGVNFGFAL